MNYKYKIFSPSGNDTALVMEKVSSKEDKKIINDIIMKKHKNVEQVGFMYMENSIPTLEMAGGEFCGNASRCLAYEYLGAKNGEVDIKVSGTYNVLKAGIDKDNNTWCEMPLDRNSIKNIIEIIDDETSIVTLKGITHIVKTNSNTSLSQEELKSEAKKELLKNGLTKNKLAVGVIFVEYGDTKEIINIKPIVFVSQINTLFYESACGSGTIALGLDIAYREGKDVSLAVGQPSGGTINCQVQIFENVVRGRISGKVEKIFDGFLSYSDFSKY